MVKPEKPQPRLGWIAPNGDYYPCGYGCHTDLANKLFDQLYDYEETNYVSDLSKLGWIKFHGFGVYVATSYVTYEQKNTLKKICDAVYELETPDFNWREYYFKNPENYENSSFFKSVEAISCPTSSIYEYLKRSIYNHVDSLDVKLSTRRNSHPGD